ncbi:MAG: hypothetical protein IPG44_16925 [Anaerolineales bacterium]|nr:hypothetical protein [Anaerolineales bacterium]
MMKPEKQFSFYLLALLLPLLILLGPVIAGYSWSSIGPNSPGLGGRQFNSLNPPEGYAGRMPDQPITIEPWGASVINVPYEVRIRQYLFEKELPLWNPYQGIGQPFAAQGEGALTFHLPFYARWYHTPNPTTSHSWVSLFPQCFYFYS